MTVTKGAVAAPHFLATQAGNRAFGEGGSAVDAAIAAAAVLSVVYPHMCAPGGDVQALMARPGGAVKALSGSGAAAATANAAALRASHAVMPIHGVHPITVPGMVAAWGELHAAGGRLPWRSLFKEALVLAAEGVPVAPALGRDLQALQERLAKDAGLRAVFFHPDGRVLATGETLRQPALAASLSAIAEQGASAMYEGDLAARLVRGLRQLGAPLSLQDFAAHRSEWLEPLSGRFGALEVLSSPPVAQGFVLLQLLAALERMELGSADPLGPGATHLTRLCALTADTRDRCLADPRHVAVDVAGLLSPQHIENLVRHALDLSRPIVSAPSQSRPDGDTVAIVAMDADGYAVTLIQSIYHAFGSGILEPGTGIVCHNRGAAFTLHEGRLCCWAGVGLPARSRRRCCGVTGD